LTGDYRRFGRLANARITVRVGRELEASPAIRHDQVAQVLAGRASYDALDGMAQTIIRASWSVKAAERLNTLDFAGQLRASGKPWVDADADGVSSCVTTTARLPEYPGPARGRQSARRAASARGAPPDGAVATPWRVLVSRRR
jgi:hypothetical protein